MPLIVLSFLMAGALGKKPPVEAVGGAKAEREEAGVKKIERATV